MTSKMKKKVLPWHLNPENPQALLAKIPLPTERLQWFMPQERLQQLLPLNVQMAQQMLPLIPPLRVP